MEEIHRMNHMLKPAGHMSISDDEPEVEQSGAQTNASAQTNTTQVE